MKRTSIYTLVLGTLVTTGLFGVFSVAIVHAQQPAYTPLAPLPCTTLKDSNVVPNCTQDAKTTTLTNYLPGVFTLAIGLAAAMAFVMISWGGFTLITTDSVYGKQEGREKVWNAVKGLVLVLGAWAILFTINPQLVNFNLNVSTPDYSQIPTITVSDGNGGTINVTPLTTAQLADDTTVRSALKNSGVEVYAPACQANSTTNCVNVTGLQTDTVLGVEGLQLACKNAGGSSDGCVTLSGGTEGGHSATGGHSDGTAVDIKVTDPTLNTVITSNATGCTNGGKPCTSGGMTAGNTYTYGNGSYYWEPKGCCAAPGVPASSGDHWHVNYK